MQALLGPWVAGAVVIGMGAQASARAPAPSTPFSANDLQHLERLSDVVAAADGRRIAYTVHVTDMNANQERSSVWVLDTHKRNAAAMRVSDEPSNASAAAWSEDGRFLYFLSDRGGSRQVWRASLDGAHEPQPVTHLPLDVGSFRLAPRAERLIVTLEVFTDCAELACTPQRLEALAHRPGHGQLYDRLFDPQGDHGSEGRRSQLFAIALDSAGLAVGIPVPLMSGIDGDVPSGPCGGREDYAVSPDGSEVAFAVRTARRGEPSSMHLDVYAVAASGGTPRNLTAEDPGWSTHPAYSPDGARLAYLATDRADNAADRLHLVVLDLKSGQKRPLTQDWDRSISSFAWSRDGRTLFASADHLGQRPLWAIDAATGHAAAITGAGHIHDFSVASSRIFYTASSLGHPPEIAAVGFDGGKPQQLTHANQTLLASRALSEYEQFSFEGWNQENVFGYLVKPAAFKRDGHYPLALIVHEGPEMSLANEWHWRWNAATLAGAGYAVLLIDFHGSTGYGQAFSDSIIDDWTGKPLEDLKRGLAVALKRYGWLDPMRVCALGDAYGGYLIEWIAGQWPYGFKCLVSQDGVFDRRPMFDAGESLWFREREHGGPRVARPAGEVKDNPVDHLAEWVAPMLIIHGRLDERVPYEQGLAAFTALQRRGIPSQFLYFPDENQTVLKPGNRLQWYDTVIAWLNRWTK